MQAFRPVEVLLGPEDRSKIVQHDQRGQVLGAEDPLPVVEKAAELLFRLLRVSHPEGAAGDIAQAGHGLGMVAPQGFPDAAVGLFVLLVRRFKETPLRKIPAIVVHQGKEHVFEAPKACREAG